MKTIQSSAKNYTHKLNHTVITNLANVNLWLLIPSFLILLLFALYFIFFTKEANFVDAYVNTQKDLFFYLNSKLSVLSSIQSNLTQLGDVLIFFALITVLIIYTPRAWGALLASAIFSLIASAGLKKIFAVPRPAAMFDIESFVIIGRTLKGRTSLPSGHSIATFVVITVLLFAFMPKKNSYKMIWTFFMFSLGMFIAFSRVGVGAHYPFDVIIGSIIGYIVAVLGIITNNKVNWLHWIENKKYYPIFALVILIWAIAIVQKIINTNLFIFYLSLLSLIITLYLMTRIYVKKIKSK